VSEEEEIEAIADRLLTETGPDLRIEHQGSVVLLEPLTAGGKTWLEEQAPKDSHWLQESLVVQPDDLVPLLMRASYDFIEVSDE
jgi:hypothetical protein